MKLAVMLLAFALFAVGCTQVDLRDDCAAGNKISCKELAKSEAAQREIQRAQTPQPSFP